MAKTQRLKKTQASAAVVTLATKATKTPMLPFIVARSGDVVAVAAAVGGGVLSESGRVLVGRREQMRVVEARTVGFVGACGSARAGGEGRLVSGALKRTEFAVGGRQC